MQISRALLLTPIHNINKMLISWRTLSHRSGSKLDFDFCGSELVNSCVLYCQNAIFMVEIVHYFIYIEKPTSVLSVLSKQ